MKKNKNALDKLWLGFVLGALVPLIAFYLYYVFKYNDIAFFEYLKSMNHYKLLFKIMSLCVLTDLPLFYGLMQFKLMRAARGVVMACFIFAFMVMGYRILN